MISYFLPPTKDWTSDDAAALRGILDNEIFRRAVAFVVDSAPRLLDGADVNKTLVASGEVKGFNAAFAELFRLTREQPEAVKSPENYPDLDSGDWAEIDKQNAL